MGIGQFITRTNQYALYRRAYQQGNPKEFREYVDRYCGMYNITPEEACKHTIVMEVYKQYISKSNNKEESKCVHTDQDYSDDRSC